MLTKYDEYLCHQMPSTFDHVETSSRQWTERIILHTHDTTGQLHMSNGFGLYQNRNIIDAFACLTVDGKTQYNVRASRELLPQIDEIKVGPFSYEVTEPLKKVRYTLQDNEYGLSYDLIFNGVMPAHEEDAQFFRLKGRVEEDMRRFDQVGRASGWIKVEGKTYNLDESNFYVERDHSWGIRRGGGVPETGIEPGDIPEGYLYSWGVIQFPSWGGAYHIRESWDSKPLLASGGIFYPYGIDNEEQHFTAIEHNFQLRRDLRKINSGELTFHLAGGGQKTISMRPLSFCCMKAGGYFGYRDFVHGQWMGPYFIDGFKLDLSDPAVLADVSFLDNTSCELQCDGETGYGVFELVITGKYPKYNFAGY